MNNPEDLEITTIEDAIYMGMKNDVSLLIADSLLLYEHQSSYNPNMPIRGFMYFGKLCSKTDVISGFNYWLHLFFVLFFTFQTNFYISI